MRLGPQVVRLRPAPHARTPVARYALSIQPKPHFLNWQQDPQGNFLARLVFPDPVRHFEIGVDLAVDLASINPFDFFLEPQAETLPFEYDPTVQGELLGYLVTSQEGPRLDAWMQELHPEGRGTVDFLVELNQDLHRRVGYAIRMEHGVQSPEQTLSLARGSCRDTSWLLVQMLRRLGLAARFVSGYLVQLRPDQSPIEGPPGPERDFADLHAWAEVYLPGAGWIGLDPTSGMLTAEGHIPLCCSPDPVSAAPVSGAVEECEVDFFHELRIERIRETPRVTLPYTEPVWERIDALARRIDAELVAADVRLTMGGEPTFVSLDDPDGEEWNVAALGESKRRLAGVLFRKLGRRFAKDPLLHYGLGKWYPGERLPRWALGCYFRADGGSIWHDGSLVAEDGAEGATADLARRFIEKLALRLEVEPGHALPAYEDVFAHLLRERRLPINVSPLESKLEDPVERERLAWVFERGLGQVVGYALPMRPRRGGGWRSGAWFMRRETLYLVPGDSPMGFRLPIDSLPWVAEDEYPFVVPPDPFALRPGLTEAVFSRASVGEKKSGQPEPSSEGRPAPGQSAYWIVRTALCIEPRDGILHVFLPPLDELESYLDLVARVEAVAAELGTPVRLEGYPPPDDPRLEKLTVTPDPGVIEVNLHFSRTWGKLVEITTGVYEEARASRLGTEKFLLDGRHCGTGGGNHITLGGATPAESPLLRRPDLLASLLGYFHDHPSLSYLFSGLFIGPTSQAPRVDEARHEASYELETALGEARRLSEKPGEPAPWLVDRIFRNLLADVTGNTHRTELCIDKLYSPDSPSGRLGLLELRSFEMSPHPRMSLVQVLLIRSLVARFWQRPYRSPVVRWGTSLHDRFMLPHFVWQDLLDVIREQVEAGYALEASWFLPHREFRFPVLGSVVHDGVEVEVRRALEPWHVLPEETKAGATARGVDSSLERIELMVRGAVPTRHGLVCNGARVPLHPTGTQGQYLAGVRYRAWQLPSELHPTIGVHAPLEVALFDRWSERALGGFVLHAAHPGGRAYATRPVNAAEAEARRAGLFQPFGHPPGWVDPSRLLDGTSPDFPLTLDLRRVCL